MPRPLQRLVRRNVCYPCSRLRSVGSFVPGRADLTGLMGGHRGHFGETLSPLEGASQEEMAMERLKDCSMVLRSMATGTAPTPPGIGVLAEATGATHDRHPDVGPARLRPSDLPRQITGMTPTCT